MPIFTYKGSHYCIIEGDNLAELAASVDAAIADGWRPTGGIASQVVSAEISRTHEPWAVSISHIWVQAFTR